MGKDGKNLAKNVSPVYGVFSSYGDAQKDAARAAGAAAMAQQGEARRQFDIAQGYRQDAINATEPLTIAAMAQMDKVIGMQEKNISRQEQMIAQIDPTILEASNQALKLLRGEQSSTLNPLKSQRDQQRMRLLNNLREQLGPGAETSTAGLQALNRFDMETDSLFAGAQQQALQNVTGVFSNFNAGRPDMMREYGGLGNMIGSRADIRFRQQDLINGLNQGVFGAGQQMIGTAGAEFTQDMMRAKQRQANYGQLMQAGTQIGAAFLTGGASAAVPGGGGVNPQGQVNYTSSMGGPIGGGSYRDVGNIA